MKHQPKACASDLSDDQSHYLFTVCVNRLLGHWEEAYRDLSKSCQLDYDDDANQALHEVEPRVCSNCLYLSVILCGV